MSDLSQIDPVLLAREELIEQNRLLTHVINELELNNHSLMSLLVDISRRMQVSSASIKAAATSLLDHDIFWDASTQYEFLQTIDHSVNDLSNLAMLVSLASRLRVDKLKMKPEPQFLQEILSILDEDLRSQLTKLELDVVLPPEGKTVFVDYEYLMTALRLLFEAIDISNTSKYNLKVIAKEMQDHWVMEIENIPSSIYKLVCDLSSNLTEEFMRSEHISADIALRIYTAYYIFRLQEIDLSACAHEPDISSLMMVIPSKQK